MSVSPSTIAYCCPSATSASGQTSAFVIRRHDTCPWFELEVKSSCGSIPDLEGWTAFATLFWRDWIQSTVCADETIIPLDNVSNAMAGDQVRIEDPDNPEIVTITSVDRVAYVIHVTRSATPAPHPQDTVVYGIRAADIPIEIISETTDWMSDSDVVVVDSSAPQLVTVRTLLRIRWRESDTAKSGSYYVEIQLRGPDGEKLTFPRESLGYPVKIITDSDGA